MRKWRHGEAKSLAQAHTELGFETKTGLPASLWPTLVVLESRLVLLFKFPRASLSLIWASVAPSVKWEAHGWHYHHHPLRGLSLEQCQALRSAPSKYLLVDHSSRWLRSAWAKIPALLLPGRLVLGKGLYLSESQYPKLENV